MYQNSSQKRTQRVEKPPGTAKTVLQTMVCDKIVSWASACGGTPKQSSKTCLARQKCSQEHSNLRYMVWFAMKLSPVYQSVDVYQNRPQKFTQRDEKPPGTVKSELQTMVCDEIISWAFMCRVEPKYSPKTYLTGRKTPRYSQKQATNYGLRQNRLPGISVWSDTEINVNSHR